ncbi:unnamed protein product [Wickerhamomyces anomalus]
MAEQPLASGPGPYTDIPPYEVVTQQLFSIGSRRGSVHSNTLGAGNILDLFRPTSFHDGATHHHTHEDNDDDDFIDPREPHNYHSAAPPSGSLKPTMSTLSQNLRNPSYAAHEQQSLLDNDIISSFPARRASLATLKRIRSHSTIKHVISTGFVPEVETSLGTEIKILGKYSIPLIITFLLQYSLNVASVFSVGRIGKTELAAVSLAGMTANITGYCLFQGTSTSLDTLCAQAFGLDDLELIDLASTYLGILSIGLPGFILFENGKHYLQSQNIFHASTYVILIAAPFNAVLNYLLVWDDHIGLGFVGAPIAIVITNYLMAILLFIYCYKIDGYQCWCGFTKDGFKNWNRMLSLSYNGCIGVLSEWLAFEIITLSAARFGTVVLASQSVIATICVLLYQIPFAISIAASTRIANFIGAASKKSLIVATNAALLTSIAFGFLNGGVLTIFRVQVVELFSSDPEVISLASKIIPLGAAYQVNDSLAAVSGGILRGQGRQRLAAYLSLIAYYLIALPIGFSLAFGLDMKLYGLWCGLCIALFLVSILQTWSVVKSDWDEIIEESIQEALHDANYINSEINEVRSIISHSIHDISEEA